jgi:uncharacterized caspase-like protein
MQSFWGCEMLRIIFSLLISMMLPSLAQAQKRLALVVGNSAYTNVAPLINPSNDATDIAQKLKTLGFNVTLAVNANRVQMIDLLRDFRGRVTQDDVALFFFAGHGVTVNNESFLVPVDAPQQIDLDESGDPRSDAVHWHLISMASVLGPLEASKIGIAFLDACRTNAAEPGMALRVVSLQTNRAVAITRGTGSLQIKPSPHSAGVFRAYATQLDNAAADGMGRNSPFTKALLAHIATKGITIQDLMIRVRKSVMKDTDSKQIPWEEAALNESFYFVAPAVAPTVSTKNPLPVKPAHSAPSRPAGPPTMTGIQ